MIEQEEKNIDQQKKKKLLILNQGDKELSPEQIEDIEGPIDNEDPFKAPDFALVKEKLSSQGLEVIGDRELWSGGSFGPLFRLKVRDSSGQEKYIIERTFTEFKDIERRFFLTDKKEGDGQTDTEPRYEIIDGTKEKLLIDYLYNEEQALHALQKIKGVPKFFGAAYDDLLGSTMQEFIEGYDLSIALAETNPKDRRNLVDALEKVKAIYIEAAKAGYVHTDPLGSTIMVDGQAQPYLTDWYLYEHGSIEGDEVVKQKYLAGLKSIEDTQRQLLSQAA